MKLLVVICHPSGEKINEVIQSEMPVLYEKYKLEFELRDLYGMGFNSVLSADDMAATDNETALEDVLTEQECIRSSDLLTFIYPVGWSGMPAMMKGYIDRVFSKGFAYAITEKGFQKLLKGKKVVIVHILDQSLKLYSMSSDLHDQLIKYDKQVFESCGMDILLHYYVESTDLECEIRTLKLKMDDLKTAIKKSLFVNRNSRLSIPTTFF